MIRSSAAVTLALAVAAYQPLAGQSSQRYTLSGSRIAIYNLAGKAVVQAGTGSSVVVDVVRGGPDGAKLTVDTGPIRDRTTLRVRYPDDRIVYPDGDGNTTLRVRDDGTFNGDDHGDRGDRVEVSTHGGGLDAHADLTISVPKGQEVAVYVGVGMITASNVDGTIHLDTGASAVNATDMSGDLDVDVGSGDVSVRSMTGGLKIDTGSGRVNVSEVKGDMLDLDTGSGSVTVADATVSRLRVDTGSGDVELSGVGTPDVDLDTGSGTVRLGLTSDADRIKIDTGSGSVTITVPPTFGAELDIEPGSGGFESELPITTRHWSSDHITGTVGDGKGTLRVDTGSGGVRLRKAQ